MGWWEERVEEEPGGGRLSQLWVSHSLSPPPGAALLEDLPPWFVRTFICLQFSGRV